MSIVRFHGAGDTDVLLVPWRGGGGGGRNTETKRRRSSQWVPCTGRAIAVAVVVVLGEGSNPRSDWDSAVYWPVWDQMMSEGRCPPPPPPLLPVRHVYTEVSIVPACSLSRGTSRIISVSVTSGGTTMNVSDILGVSLSMWTEGTCQNIYIIATDTEIKKKTKSQLLCRTAGPAGMRPPARGLPAYWQDSHVTVGTVPLCCSATTTELEGHNWCVAGGGQESARQWLSKKIREPWFRFSFWFLCVFLFLFCVF